MQPQEAGWMVGEALELAAAAALAAVQPPLPAGAAAVQLLLPAGEAMEAAAVAADF